MPPPTLAKTRLEQLEDLLRATLPMGRIEPRWLPGCPAITLGLISDDFPTGPLPADVMQAVIARPAYWALCWGSGLALARYLLDHPAWVAGRTVLDLGSGSGVVAIAAALAGARRVTACDTDPDARQACVINASLNRVSIDVCESLERAPRHSDLLLMADLLYDRSNLALLTLAAERAQHVLVADSRIADLPHPAYRKLTEIPALTYPNLGEFDEFGTVRLFFRDATVETAPAAPPAP